MRMTHTDIKAELIDNWQQFADNQYPEDLLNEFADSAVPVYYNEIIEDWQEMPNEFEDYWREDGIVTSDTTIFNLMAYDLHNYYQHQYHVIYNELCDEMEPTNA